MFTQQALQAVQELYDAIEDCVKWDPKVDPRILFTLIHAKQKAESKCEKNGFTHPQVGKLRTALGNGAEVFIFMDEHAFSIASPDIPEYGLLGEESTLIQIKKEQALPNIRIAHKMDTELDLVQTPNKLLEILPLW